MTVIPSSATVAKATTFFDYAEQHEFALFPCAAGTKRPILPWKTESSFDRKQWVRWVADRHNLAIDCAKSGLIVLDVDSSKVSRAEAWQAYHDLCLSWGLASPPAAMTQSARAGWHVPVKRSTGLAATDLRGGGTLIKISDVRPLAEGEKDGEVIGFKNRGYCVAPGSYLDSDAGPLFYLPMPEAPAPHECPAGLIDLIRLPVVEAQANGPTGVSEPTDVAALVAFLDGHGEFDTEPEWFAALGAIKLACGDTEDGLLVARQITNDDATEEALLSRWNRLVSNATARPGVKLYTIGSMIKRAEKLGRKFHVGKSAKAMFDGVPLTPSPSIAPTALPAGETIGEANAKAMFGDTYGEFAKLAAPIVDMFLSCTTDVPAPQQPVPMFPEEKAKILPAGFGDKLKEVVNTIAGIADHRAQWKGGGRVLKPLAIIKALDEPTFRSLETRIVMRGNRLPADKFRQECTEFEAKLQIAVRGHATSGFIANNNGRPDSGNSDNVATFLTMTGRAASYDKFTRSVEINGERMSQNHLDDAFVEARSNKYGLQVEKDFFRTTIKAVARRGTYDSLQAYVEGLPKWDGAPRLDTWLSKVCHVEADKYHAIAGRTIIGGMIARARRPGCYFRHVPLFIGIEQNEGKTYLCRIMGGENWTLTGFKLGGTDQNMMPLLPGKWIVELGELAGLKRDNVEDVKKFLSSQKDEFVAKWESEPTEYPRRCCFWATSNGEEPLLDDNNHRFLPIHVNGALDIEWIKENREQLLAEAVWLDDQPGHSWDIARGDDDKLIREKQEAARFKGALEDQIADWFGNEKTSFIMGSDLQAACRMAGHGVNVRPGKFMKKQGFRRQLIGPKRLAAWTKGTLQDSVQLQPKQAQPNGAVTFTRLQGHPYRGEGG